MNPEVFVDVKVQDNRIVWLTRTEVPYESVEQIEAAYQSVLQRLGMFKLELLTRQLSHPTKHKAPFAWLFDVRYGAPARNDDDFENAQAQFIHIFLKESDLLCTLCATQTGVMQISRLAKQLEPARLFATTDEHFAVRELQRRLNEVH